MLNKVYFGLVLLILGLSVTTLAGAPRMVYVKCGRLIYDTEKAPLENAAIVITDGKVTELGANLQAPAGAQILDFSAYTVIPGLVDAHTHIWTGPRSANPAPTLAALRAAKAVSYALH
ncbi:MAG TPA: hypothetical protein VLZ81_12850, partial [Blastocatellia bacterium]|nr:hypothetical protein [Blastocatellia bacterium]